MPKLSTLIGTALEITNPTGTYLHVIKSDGLGGYDSCAISYANFVALIASAVDDLESVVGTKNVYLAQSSDFNETFLAGTLLQRITLTHVSGTVTVRVGTTLGGNDVLPEVSIIGGVETYVIEKTYVDAPTLYVTRSSGTFNMVIHVIQGYI